jgi:nucleoside-diphosphate-sugar epimerase
MRIFFTGGSGKAGRHVAPYLAEQGHHVTNADGPVRIIYRLVRLPAPTIACAPSTCRARITPGTLVLDKASRFDRLDRQAGASTHDGSFEPSSRSSR